MAASGADDDSLPIADELKNEDIHGRQTKPGQLAVSKVMNDTGDEDDNEILDKFEIHMGKESLPTGRLVGESDDEYFSTTLVSSLDKRLKGLERKFDDQCAMQNKQLQERRDLFQQLSDQIKQKDEEIAMLLTRIAENTKEPDPPTSFFEKMARFMFSGKCEKIKND